MVNGNPQAIEMMTRSGLYWSRAPKDMYCFLLGLRSNRPSAHPAKFETSDTEDEPEKPRSRTRLDGVYESLQSMDWGRRISTHITCAVHRCSAVQRSPRGFLHLEH
ncbi:hypothetical protein DER44DRAFT_774519 [Fusarium oxysporum]|nr:hypothetical protein DER44DRAFT_774519 [Fusarium oxysporum]